MAAVTRGTVQSFKCQVALPFPTRPARLRRMIQRYSRAEMREIWTEQRKLQIWLQIELLAAEALSAEGLVPRKDLAQMKSRAGFSIDRCKELERVLNHDVVAFTTNVAE